jgi:site-specific DNA-methyltransferase (adenine-specific)
VRNEWDRSGVPLYKANEVCGVKNAATRKYLTKDHLWYFPPPEMIVAMADHLNTYGKPTSLPYYSLDGITATTVGEWRLMRAKWNHIHGVTNVWDVQPLHGKERLRVSSSGKSLHYNQKPMSIIDYLIRTTTDTGDVIWDPFAGLATVGSASNRLFRKCFCAEISNPTFNNAMKRLNDDLEVESCLVS